MRDRLGSSRAGRMREPGILYPARSAQAELSNRLELEVERKTHTGFGSCGQLSLQTGKLYSDIAGIHRHICVRRNRHHRAAYTVRVRRGYPEREQSFRVSEGPWRPRSNLRTPLRSRDEFATR